MPLRFLPVDLEVGEASSPPPSPPREWLPSGLTGGGGSQKSGGMLSGMSARVNQAIAPARETAAIVVPGTGQNDNLCPSLSFKQRLQGCLGCFVLGLCLSFLGFISWWTGHMAQFGVFYTLGNITSVASSCFIIGPKRQMKNMTKAGRRVASGIFVTMMIVTLAIAFSAPDQKALVLICCVAQWCALVWYIASYIPYGRKILTKVLGRVTEF